MTLMEILKQLLGSKADEEIDLDNKEEVKDKEVKDKEVKEEVKDKEIKEASTLTDKTEKENMNNDDSVDNKVTSENKDNTVKEDEENMAIFEDGWFNSETGAIDESKIKNAEALKAIQTISEKIKQERDKRAISDSLADELKNYSLNVSEDTLKKVLDMSNVTIDKDNKVVGVKEALEALKASEPGFFKDKDKESNPLNEGFNPVEKQGTDNINSFSQAFKLMEEIN